MRTRCSRRCADAVSRVGRTFRSAVSAGPKAGLTADISPREPLRLFGEERAIVCVRFDVDESAHAVMTEAAELRAGNFVIADPVRNEPHRRIEAGNRILLH